MNAQEKIAKLEKELEDTQKKLSVALNYSPSIYRRKSCSGYYAPGYICDCGRDNSMSDEEWAQS